MANALSSYGGIAEGIPRISAHSYMEYTADTADQKAKAWLDRAEDLEAETKNRTLFFRLWWTGLDDNRAGELIPDDRDDAYALASWRKLKPYTLGEKVEQAINVKNTTGFSGWIHHYDKITANFVFVVKVKGKTLRDEKGRPRKMVVDEVVRLFASPDAPTREAAYRTLLAKYAKNGGVLGEVYRTIVRDWRNENMKLRGYRSAIAPRNLENDVPDETVSTLLEVCRKNAPVFQDFFSMKAKLLGMKKMSRYHIYAPVLTFEAPLVLAETASVFGEMILFDRMMSDETDAEVKRSVLLDKITSMYGTIGRQAHFVLFESTAHEAVDSGATVEDLCSAYLATLKGQFGMAVEVPEKFKWEWTYIPHIYHTPFHCYAYAFDNLLSLALYDTYTKEGRSFVPKYLKILSYGGSASPTEILQEVGFDLRSEDFWQSGFDVIGRMVAQLRRL